MSPHGVPSDTKEDFFFSCSGAGKYRCQRFDFSFVVWLFFFSFNSILLRTVSSIL